MKRILIFLMMIAVLSNASMFDFSYIKKANEAYKKGDFNKAASYYQKIDKPNDEVRFNLADSYYKMKQYKKAAEIYKNIKDEKLQFKKLHNLGNCYANLKKIDEGIKAYEKALKIKEDKDTRYNLELLKKMKKRQKNKKNKNQKQNKNNKKTAANKKPKKEPISDMEVRKYNKMLNKRGINTLMLPLKTKKGERQNENIKPW